jgi:beta-glucosidase
MGYRGFDARGTDPAFCFGHGLGYSTFAWGAVSASATLVELADLQAGSTVTVSAPVTNSGSRPGAAVVQRYPADDASTLRRPPQELKAFQKLHLDPGATATAELELDLRSFAAWDPATSSWVVEPGTFQVHLGRSSRDIDQSITVGVTAPPE